MMIGNVKYVKKLQAESFSKLVTYEFGSGMSFNDRLQVAYTESDAFGIRTCSEIEARFIDHLAQNLPVPVLLTGPVLREKADAPVDEKWEKWLTNFEPGSVVFCAFGTQTRLQKSQFQELLFGFELSRLPFLLHYLNQVIA
ncbi:UDP-Glycosyltransferase superfamily protein [Euphorbia peplus]|nr:UDP-Glycosyltransferase superfamily protein [Euphorbia peplus]